MMHQSHTLAYFSKDISWFLKESWTCSKDFSPLEDNMLKEEQIQFQERLIKNKEFQIQGNTRSNEAHINVLCVSAVTPVLAHWS